MAEQGAVSGTDLPVKRPREEEENMGENHGNGASTVSMEKENKRDPECISSIIPGWFSEISPMWPGLSLIESPFFFVDFVCPCLA